MQSNQLENLKEKYLEYYRDCPIQKYAAMSIGRTEETIINWRKEDLDFSNQVEAARAAWVKLKLKKANVEWALERLEKEVFGDPDKAKDLLYERFQQFIFIFTLSPDELRRFIQAGVSRASIGNNGDSASTPKPVGEGEKGRAVDATEVSG